MLDRHELERRLRETPQQTIARAKMAAQRRELAALMQADEEPDLEWFAAPTPVATSTADELAWFA